VSHGPGERGWDTIDDPTIVDPADAVVRIDTSTICGSDLHILKGDVPETVAGTVLGHEAVGTTFELATELIRHAGRVANIGVHGQPATLTRHGAGAAWARKLPTPMAGIRLA